jgi:hypothetical protein
MSTSLLKVIHQAKEDKMRFHGIHIRHISSIYLLSITVAILFVMTFPGSLPAAVKQKSFGSAEEAVQAFISAGRNNDDKELSAIFGPDGKDIMFSGDKTADKQRRENFLARYDDKNKLVREGNSTILVIGKDEWPFPIPIEKKGTAWVFDTKKGKEEILNRRIGENELSTIKTCLAVVDAQREYAMIDRDGDDLQEYAEKFASDPGKKNGLYWETKEGEKPSPLGELVAKAKSEGYSKKGATKPVPYHGYYFKILKGQGKNADGGAYDYMVKGNMIGGFAVVAWPAIYGNSGIMTFIVNYDGVVYQKNLGKNTEKIAKSMTKYDPDKTWAKAQK